MTRKSVAALLVQLGHINALHHHTELAQNFCNEALGMYRRLHNADGIAHTYNQLGLLDGNLQEFSQALKYDRDNSSLIETYESMDHNFEEKGENEKALSYYLRALTPYETRKQRSEAYFVLLENIGNPYQKKGDSRNVLHYLQRSRHWYQSRSANLIFNQQPKSQLWYKKRARQRTELIIDQGFYQR